MTVFIEEGYLFIKQPKLKLTSLVQPSHLTGDNPASEWSKPYQENYW